MSQPKYIVVNFSGGKDSTAMLLRMIELDYKIDEVVFCDTLKEFPQMYKHIEKVKKVVEDKGIKFTTLKSDLSFDFWMFDYTPKRRKPEEFREKYGDVTGLSWADSRVRWCSRKLKIDTTDKYFKELSKDFNVIQNIGIAADETLRLEKESNKQENHKHPLVEWGWSEADCLNYCYSLGYDWGGLYEIFNRVSCWCCPFKTLDELRQLKKHFPQLWEELKEMDSKTWRAFRKDFTVEELDKRFSFEEQRIAEGKSIKNKEFFKELQMLLSGKQYGAD